MCDDQVSYCDLDAQEVPSANTEGEGPAEICAETFRNGKSSNLPILTKRRAMFPTGRRRVEGGRGRPDHSVGEGAIGRRPTDLLQSDGGSPTLGHVVRAETSGV